VLARFSDSSDAGLEMSHAGVGDLRSVDRQEFQLFEIPKTLKIAVFELPVTQFQTGDIDRDREYLRSLQGYSESLYAAFGYICSQQVERVEIPKARQAGQVGVADVEKLQSKRLDVRQAGDMLEPLAGDLRAAQDQAPELFELRNMNESVVRNA